MEYDKIRYLELLQQAESLEKKGMSLYREDRDRFAVNCEPNIESKGFAKWMDKIFSRCEVFEPEAQKNEQYGKKWLKDSVSNVLIQIQKEYNF